MANPLSVNCPGCGTTLKLKSDRVVGKRISCPLCTERFVVPGRAVSASPAPSPKPREGSAPRVVRQQNASDRSLQVESSRPKSPPRPKKLADAPPVEEFAALDEFDSFADEAGISDDITPARSASVPKRLPAAQTLRSSKPKKSARGDKQDSGNTGKWVLIGGSVLIGLSLLTAVIYLGMGAVSRVQQIVEKRRASFNLAYLPKYPFAVAFIRVADIWESPFVKSLSADAGFRDAIAKMSEKVGLTPSEIESVIFASGPPPELMGPEAIRRVAGLKAASGMSSSGAPRSVIIIRAKKPLDISKIATLLEASKTRHKTEDVQMLLFDMPYVFSSWENSAAAFPDEKTMIVGNQTSVEAAISDKGTVPNCPELETLDSRQHIVLAMLPRNTPPSSSAALFPNGKQVRDPVETLRSEVKLLASTLNFTDGLQLKSVSECYSAETTRSIHRMLTRPPHQHVNHENNDENAEKDGEVERNDLDLPINDGIVGAPMFMPGIAEIEDNLRKSRTVELTNGDMRIEIAASIGPADLEGLRKQLIRLAPFAAAGELADADRAEWLNSLPGENAKKMAEGDNSSASTADPTTTDNASEPSTNNAEKQSASETASDSGVSDGENQFKDPEKIVSLLKGSGASVSTGQDGSYHIFIDVRGFSDDDLRPIIALRGLSSISVMNSAITDRGMRYIAANAESLTGLSLNGTKISDKGLALLDPEKFKMIRTLSLSNVNNLKVTNACVPYLARLSTLEKLFVRDTLINAEGAEKLKAELPNCKVVANAPPRR